MLTLIMLGFCVCIYMVCKNPQVEQERMVKMAIDKAKRLPRGMSVKGVALYDGDPLIGDGQPVLVNLDAR